MKSIFQILIILVMQCVLDNSIATHNIVLNDGKIEVKKIYHSCSTAGLAVQVLDNDDISPELRSRIQLVAFALSLPQIGISIYDAVTTARNLRTQHPNDYDAVQEGLALRREAARRDLEGHPEAWEFVRTHPRGADAWEALLHVDVPKPIRTNVTYLSVVSKQLTNYPNVLFKFERVLPNIPSNKLEDFFSALDNPKSIDHVRSLAGDFENIPGINLSIYNFNGLPSIEIPAPATWADPLLGLPANVAGNFTNVSAKTLSPGQKIYRILGDAQSPPPGFSEGGYWTYTLPTSKANLFGDYAVRPEWNAATHYKEFTVPEGGLKIWDGPAAKQQILTGINEVNLGGGGIQIYVPDPYRIIENEFDNLPLHILNL